MGDCRMKIVISKNTSSTSLNAEETIVKEYASDATIRDVRDDFFGSLSLNTICIWDCTLHPPKDISKWLFEEFPDHTGPKSKTLYDAGCFPSAVWQVLPHGTQPANRSVMEDIQYNNLRHAENNNVSSTIASTKVELLVDSQPITEQLKPSEVLHSITKRFKGDSADDMDAAQLARRKNQLERRAKEAARNQKLEARIKKLKGINKGGASEQVRKMLLKSRCTGAESLKMQDRIYLHVAVIHGGETDVVSEQFRYFSRQDTVARIVQSCFAPKPPQQVELLVSVSDQTYRRLPITLRLYEATEKGFLKEVDSIVIRYFGPPDGEPTTSILEDDKEDVEPLDVSMTDVVQEEHSPIPPDEPSLSSAPAALPQDLVDRFNTAVAVLDKKSKTKKSASAIKVRQMMMKSKAKGDVKRTPKIENRFFVELVLVVENNGSASSSFVFMARQDSVERLLKEHVKTGCKAYATMKDEGAYVEIPTESSLEELEARNLLHCFDRLVVVVAS